MAESHQRNSRLRKKEGTPPPKENPLKAPLEVQGVKRKSEKRTTSRKKDSLGVAAYPRTSVDFGKRHPAA